MAKQLGFYFDQNYCTGCKACQIACKDKNDLPVGVTWRRVVEYTGGAWTVDANAGTFSPHVFTYYTSVSCNHCDNPLCVEVCPTKAMTKDPETGIVSVDADKCVGCRYCEWACPYSAPQLNPESGVMTKCDFCADYLAEGKDPACVAACPVRVLKFGEIDELRAQYGDAADIAPLPDPSITSPHLVIAPHRSAELSEVATGYIANPEEI
jgi:anaerobic dimethyl sulfoxide reductase subunit B (iron-sulfur subunit)